MSITNSFCSDFLQGLPCVDPYKMNAWFFAFSVLGLPNTERFLRTFSLSSMSFWSRFFEEMVSGTCNYFVLPFPANSTSHFHLINSPLSSLLALTQILNFLHSVQTEEKQTKALANIKVCASLQDFPKLSFTFQLQ